MRSWPWAESVAWLLLGCFAALFGAAGAGESSTTCACHPLNPEHMASEIGLNANRT